MTKTIALITGANKGIGYEIAKQLGEQGITVLTAARTQSVADDTAAKLAEKGIEAIGVQLEVTNADHIKALAQYIEDTFGRLDILVNNAGVHLEKGGYEGDVLRDSFEVNTFGPFYITEALMPLLLKSEAGRIVSQSSGLGSITLVQTNEFVQGIATPAYCASKAALNMLTVYWSGRTKGTNILVNAVHPGMVRTDMGGEQSELSVEDGAKTAVRMATLPADGPTGGFFYMNDELPW
ncbi:SDR family oxidoreductase [Paenibacillus sp. 1P07SE]|uniref:SDR family oxidoreductase n=1 Tax=Paenibacillus sp. 1P07SE TaxID=3132209 RepID=UPI0039A720E5